MHSLNYLPLLLYLSLSVLALPVAIPPQQLPDEGGE